MTNTVSPPGGSKQRGRPRSDDDLVHINLRVPRKLLEYFKQQPNYTGRMRQVLVEYMQSKDTAG